MTPPEPTVRSQTSSRVNPILSVREAAPSDVPSLCTMLALAFQEEPVMAYIFPDPDVRRARLPSFFKVIATGDIASGACFQTVGGEACTIWRAPGHGQLSFVEMLQQAWPWIASARTALGRALVYSHASDTKHPRGPHWYLHVAGCHPAAQGRGFGGAAIRAGLLLCERDGVPAYLETATESNLALYAAFGFAVTQDWRVPGGPQCWSMLRPVGARL